MIVPLYQNRRIARSVTLALRLSPMTTDSRLCPHARRCKCPPCISTEARIPVASCSRHSVRPAEEQEVGVEEGEEGEGGEGGEHCQWWVEKPLLGGNHGNHVVQWEGDDRWGCGGAQ